MKQLYIGLLCLLGLLSACTGRDASDAFAEIEACMDAHPDSALLLLGRIAHPERLRGKRRADYALLLTQARDKNYLDSLQSDSLIQLAVDYYRDGADRAKAGKAFFYAAKLQALQRNDSAAMQGYLKAQKMLEGTGEYRMQGLVQEHIGVQNDRRKLYDMALDNYRQAFSCYGECGDTLSMVYVCRDIAWTHESKHEPDSVRHYLQTGLHLLGGDTLAAVYPSLQQLLGMQEAARGHYAEAIACFQSAIRNERVRSSVYHYHMSLGDAYLQIGQTGQAEECFRKVLEADNPYTRAGGYHYFHLLEKRRGNSGKALRYKELSDSLLEVSRSVAVQNKLLTMQQEDEREGLRLASEAVRQRKEWQLNGVLLFSLLLFGGGVWGYSRIKKAHRLQRDNDQRRHADELGQIAWSHEQAIARYRQRIEALERREAQDSEDTRQQIEAFRQQIQILEEENRKIKAGECTDALSVLVHLRQHRLLAQNMTAEENRLVFDYMDASFGGFITRLREKYSLKESSLLFVSLVKLNFANDDLSFVFECEVGTVRKRKQRLREKFGVTGERSLEHFLFYYPEGMK